MKKITFINVLIITSILAIVCGCVFAVVEIPYKVAAISLLLLMVVIGYGYIIIRLKSKIASNQFLLIVSNIMLLCLVAFAIVRVVIEP